MTTSCAEISPAAVPSATGCLDATMLDLGDKSTSLTIARAAAKPHESVVRVRRALVDTCNGFGMVVHDAAKASLQKIGVVFRRTNASGVLADGSTVSVEVSEPLTLRLVHEGRVLSVRMEAVYVKGTGLGINLGRPFMKAIRGSLSYGGGSDSLICTANGVISFSMPILSAEVRAISCCSVELKANQMVVPAPVGANATQC